MPGVPVQLLARPMVRVGMVEDSVRWFITACLLWIVLLGPPSSSFAQQGVSVCDDPNLRGTAIYNKYCGACYPRCGSAGNSSSDNGAAQRAQAAAAAAAAQAAEEQRERDAELEEQRIEAESKHRIEEIANQAKFIEDRDDAVKNLRGSGESTTSDGLGASGLRGGDIVTGDSGLRGSSATPGLRGSAPIVSSTAGDTSVVDLSDTSLADANKALMRHQWAMSIDQRYKADPQVQQYIRDLWDPASEHSAEDMKHVRSILTDQLKVSGRTQQQIDSLFAALDTFYTGHGPAPKAWDKASTLAHEIDATATTEEPQRPYYKELVSTLGKADSIKATAVYMASGPQTTNDCVLHAISNGAQVPFAQVRAELAPTLKNLAIAQIEVRNTPDLAITAKDSGGTGGLNAFEEIVIANKVGNVVGVPEKSFAKAIESTHHPVITTVVIDDYKNGKLENVGNHEVAVTGVYRTADGKVYYSVMDSNLNTHPNYTAYVEKNDFEDHMVFGGGYVVVPNEKH